MSGALRVAACGILALVVFAALFGPALAPYDPLASDVEAALTAPSAAHWFGTDQLGRDVFSRTLVAARLDLAIAIGAVAVSLGAGALIGAATGFFGGLFDQITGRLVDVLMAFPLFVLAMALVAALGNSVANVVIATAVINLPFYIRLARSETRIRRDLGYVEAARLAGAGEGRVLFAVVLPNIAAPLTVLASVNLGWAILNAAGLSFLGLGVRPPAAEWGVLVAEGARFMISGQWWVAVFPGLALMLTVLACNIAGDALGDRIGARR